VLASISSFTLGETIGSNHVLYKRSKSFQLIPRMS